MIRSVSRPAPFWKLFKIRTMDYLYRSNKGSTTLLCYHLITFILTIDDKHTKNVARFRCWPGYILLILIVVIPQQLRPLFGVDNLNVSFWESDIAAIEPQ